MLDMTLQTGADGSSSLVHNWHKASRCVMTASRHHRVGSRTCSACGGACLSYLFPHGLDVTNNFGTRRSHKRRRECPTPPVILAVVGCTALLETASGNLLLRFALLGLPLFCLGLQLG